MPQEIHFQSNKNGSPMSQVSGATGLEDRLPNIFGHSMMPAALPSMEDRSGGGEERSTHSGNFFNSSHGEDDLIPRRTLFTSLQSYNCDIGANNASNEVKDQAMVDVQHAKKGSNFIVRSVRFQKLVQYVFNSVDGDGSEKICKEELYCGLIMIHLKLAAYVGPAACRVATREYVYEIFHVLDRDQSGYLDRQEFGIVMAIFGSQILTRVVVQLGMTLLIVPIAAQYVLDIWNDLVKLFKIILREIDAAGLITERMFHFFGVVLNFIVPAGIKNGVLAVKRVIGEYVLGDIYDAMPLTIISVVLGMLLVPWMLYQIDEFHSRIAEKRNGKVVMTN